MEGCDSMTYFAGMNMARFESMDLPGEAEYEALVERERFILESLMEQPKAKRNPALEIRCGCHQKHLLMSAFVLPGGDVALWTHGGGKYHDGMLADVFRDERQARREHLGETTPTRTKTVDELSIKKLEDLRAGRSGVLGMIVARCGMAYRLNPAVDGPRIAMSIDAWAIRRGNTPIWVILQDD
jgi:hypothetical protein